MLERLDLYDSFDSMSKEDLRKIYELLREVRYGLQGSNELPETWENYLDEMIVNITDYCTFLQFSVVK